MQPDALAALALCLFGYQLEQARGYAELAERRLSIHVAYVSALAARAPVVGGKREEADACHRGCFAAFLRDPCNEAAVTYSVFYVYPGVFEQKRFERFRKIALLTEHLKPHLR